MFLSFIGIAFVIIATYFVYKNARDYGRNAALWAITTFLFGFGFQWIFPFLLVIVWMIFLMVTGSSQTQAQSSVISYSGLITVGSLLLSCVFVILILRFVSRMPEERPTIAPPPSPPKFD